MNDSTYTLEIFSFFDKFTGLVLRSIHRYQRVKGLIKKGLVFTFRRKLQAKRLSVLQLHRKWVYLGSSFSSFLFLLWELEGVEPYNRKIIRHYKNYPLIFEQVHEKGLIQIRLILKEGEKLCKLRNLKGKYGTFAGWSVTITED